MSDETTETEQTTSDDVQPAEAWATKHGMLPESTLVDARVGRFATKAKRANPRYVLFAQARAFKAWPVGKELTESEFLAAVDEAQSIPCR